MLLSSGEGINPFGWPHQCSQFPCQDAVLSSIYRGQLRGFTFSCYDVASISACNQNEAIDTPTTYQFDFISCFVWFWNTFFF